VVCVAVVWLALCATVVGVKAAGDVEVDPNTELSPLATWAEEALSEMKPLVMRKVRRSPMDG